MIRRNERGNRIGESHPKGAVFSDEIVLEVRNLREHQGKRYAELIALFAERDPPVKLTYHTIRKWCNYTRR